jgi:hypothetical protein
VLDLLNRAGRDIDPLAELAQGECSLLAKLSDLPSYVDDKLLDHGYPLYDTIYTKLHICQAGHSGPNELPHAAAPNMRQALLGAFQRLMQVLNTTRQEERYEKLIDSSMPKIYSTQWKRRSASPWR